MFNRFTAVARHVVHEATRQARNEVTDEHLLLALLDQPGTTSARLLSDAGVTPSTVDTAFREAERKGGLSDAEAAAVLSELGIDVDEVVASVERALGEDVLVPPAGRNRFTRTAKDVLRGALDQAKSLRARELGDQHLLLALAAHDGVAGQLLATHGLSYLDVRARLAVMG
ncbi:Clp protease N-terminal domain-containing protein [Actinophytocola sp. NPDC049390]|uniref:Clp protease N-terminal domain-containing protein n=1 Tax=Actinophytocola sp. NPDC049390 TaxID=3363894 RepID=UPI0037968C85